MSLALLGTVTVSGTFFVAFAALVWLVFRVVDVDVSVESFPPIAIGPATTAADWLYHAGPVIATVTVFAGLLWLYRLRQRSFWRRFEAHTVAPDPALRHRLTRTAAAMDVSAPELRVLRTPVSTAMTTGVGSERTAITVTTGLIDELTADELTAVLAHELSHVKHRDVAVLTVAMIPAVVAAGLWTVCTTSRGRRDGGSPRDQISDGTQFDGLGAAFVGIFAALFWFASISVTSALARYRELAADRTAVQITGAPSDLATALSKLSGEYPAAPDLRLAELEAFAILPMGRYTPSNGWETPLQSLPERTRKRFQRRFALHPSTAERIDHLGELRAANEW